MKLKFFLNFLYFICFGKIQSIWSYSLRPFEFWCIFKTINKEIFNFLKNTSLFKFLLLNDICVVDWLSYPYRFEIIYNLSSLDYGFRGFFKFFFKENQSLFSLHDIFKNSMWLEREVWDMFGVFFAGNPDLRRILTDYGFEGFPLRKDFPLTGYLEIRFDDEKNSLVYEPVELAQEYRVFSFISPWEDVVL